MEQQQKLKKKEQQQQGKNNINMNEYTIEDLNKYAPPELNRHCSEPTQRRASLEGKTGGCNKNNNNTPPIPLYPRSITPLIIAQLRHYVTIICHQYETPDQIPYHNVEHAYHVFLSANKLLDLLLCEEPEEIMGSSSADGAGGGGYGGGNNNTSRGRSHQRRGRRRVSLESNSSSQGGGSGGGGGGSSSNSKKNKKPPRPTFGIKSDPLSQLAFLFSALVHDVDHTGISNRQLVLEMDDLAILYNDQSVAEQRSLAVAFTTLKQERYMELRELWFPRTPGPPRGASAGEMIPKAVPAGPAGVYLGNEEFFTFRKLVIDLVLVTDIASPERTQIVKSKWKEAFGEVVVAEKLKKTVMKKQAGVTRRASTDSGRGRPRYQPVKSSSSKNLMLTATAEDKGGEEIMNGDSALSGGRRRMTKDDWAGSSGSLEAGSSKSRRSGPVVQSSVASLEMDESMRDSMLEYDSIDFSDSSHSSSSLMSEDDFDASAVSRTKMNFDRKSTFNGSSNSNNSTSDGNGTGSDGAGGKSPTIGCAPAFKPRGARWSTGDLACDPGHLDLPEDVEIEKEMKKGQSSLPATLQISSLPASIGDGVGTRSKSANRPFSSSFKVTPVTMNKEGRRTSSLARVGQGLSQSMLTTRELHLRPRAQSEERRLGVRRALDLAGSTIIAYQNLRGSVSSNEKLADSTASDGADDSDFIDPDDDVDEFKATVVLEQMIRAADVAALLQGWQNSLKWSTRLYKELNNGFLLHRGEDPSMEWYENQIKFWDFYILPLAKNLGVMGVFEENVGGMFAYCVKRNLAQWIDEGARVTELMMKDDNEERRRQWEEQQFGHQSSIEKQIEGIDASIRSSHEDRRKPSLDNLSMDGIDASIRSLDAEQIHASFTHRASRSGPNSDLASSFRSVSSAKSCASSSTGASNNYGEYSRRGSLTSTKKMVDSRSLEVGEKCVVCGVIGRFTCPRCGSPYCSAKCCRDHKASGCS